VNLKNRPLKQTGKLTVQKQCGAMMISYHNRWLRSGFVTGLSSQAPLFFTGKKEIKEHPGHNKNNHIPQFNHFGCR
jgi:hypothetical protein